MGAAARLQEELMKRLNLFELEYRSLVQITQREGQTGFEIDSLQAELVFEALAQRALAASA